MTRQHLDYSRRQPLALSGGAEGAAQVAAPEPISVEQLRELLRYDPQSGKMFWRPRDKSLFRDGKMTAEHSRSIWNARYAGTEAFTADDGKGYLVGGIFGRTHLAHRVIWALVHGEWPTNQIDHINGNRADNRIENLRAATAQENAQNTKLPADNTSGVIGVSWRKRDSKWHASIKANGQAIFLGYFECFEDAVAARKAAEVKFGFHENHGRAAPLGAVHA